MTTKNLVYGSLSTTFSVVALVFLFGTSFIVDQVLNAKLVLREHSELLEKYAVVPIPIYVSFYFFNVENPENVEFEGAKPILREQGPYTFRQTRRKSIFLFVENGKQVVFRERKAYFFERELSIGDLNDLVSLPNLPKLLLANQAINPADDDEMGGMFW